MFRWSFGFRSTSIWYCLQWLIPTKDYMLLVLGRVFLSSMELRHSNKLAVQTMAMAQNIYLFTVSGIIWKSIRCETSTWISRQKVHVELFASDRRPYGNAYRGWYKVSIIFYPYCNGCSCCRQSSDVTESWLYRQWWRNKPFPCSLQAYSPENQFKKKFNRIILSKTLRWAFYLRSTSIW